MLQPTSIIPADKLDILHSKALANVATLGPSGEPQVNPVWFDWDGRHLRFGVTLNRQKYRNLQRNRRISLSIVDPANPYRYLELRGEVVRFEPDPDFSFVNSLAKKYLGVDEFPYPPEERVSVVVQPLHVTHSG